MALDELRHYHITQFRDCLLADGLHPNTVRRPCTDDLKVQNLDTRIPSLSAPERRADSPDCFIQATVALRIAVAVALALSDSMRRSASSAAETRSILEKSSFHKCESLQR